MVMNPSLDYKQARTFKRTVFFTGSTAIKKGMGFCYQQDRITENAATVAEGRRRRYVELPDNTNNHAFAGVATQAYRANSGGQFIVIFEPGSECDVALAMINPTFNSTKLTCCVTAPLQGLFITAGDIGRGSFDALQTKSGTSGILESNVVGDASLSADGLTLTDSSATFTTNSVAAGDQVVFFAGEDDVILEERIVSSVTSQTVLVLTAAASTSAEACSYYIKRGDPTVFGRLQDGPESNLVDIVIIPKAGGAITNIMPLGRSFIAGGITLASNATFTMASGTQNGQCKGFRMLGALTSYPLKITVSGLRAGVVSAANDANLIPLVLFDLVAANEYFNLEFRDTWVEVSSHADVEIDIT